MQTLLRSVRYLSHSEAEAYIYLELSVAIYAYLALFQPIWPYVCLSGTSWPYLALSSAVFAHLVILASIWRYLGILSVHPCSQFDRKFTGYPHRSVQTLCKKIRTYARGSAQNTKGCIQFDIVDKPYANRCQTDSVLGWFCLVF